VALDSQTGTLQIIGPPVELQPTIKLGTLQIQLWNQGRQGTFFFFFFFVAWGSRTDTTLAGRKMLYAYRLHDLARPTECYVGLFPKGTYATKKLPRTPALAYRPAIPQTGRWLWYGPAFTGPPYSPRGPDPEERSCAYVPALPQESLSFGIRFLDPTV
jgi:hypothetical protein